MPNGVVYLTLPLAQADQDQATAILGYPKCARIVGTVVGTVPTCACSTGTGSGVHVACPYATRRQTDVLTVTGPLPATAIAPLPALVVDAVMLATPAVVVALPTILTASPLTLPLSVAEGTPVIG